VQEADHLWQEKGGIIQRIIEGWNAAYPDHVFINAGSIENTGQLRNELRKVASKEPNPLSPAEFATEYDKLVNESARAYYAEKQKVLDQLGSTVSATGFDFIPPKFWRWPTEIPAQPRCSTGCYRFWSYWRHSPGMLLFTALLTLGAPYWYNLLKNLTSLRPALAQAIGKEEAVQSEAKK
jgi:hypothetical protein